MTTSPASPPRSHRRRYARRAALTLVSTLLVACSATDRAPPSVLERTPAPGSDDVWIGAPITVRFSARIDPESAQGVALTTDDGSPVNVSWAWSGDGTTLTGQVVGRPPVPATLTLGLPASLVGRNGVAVVAPDEPHTWTVPPWHTVGEPLRSSSGAALNHPSIAIADSGAILVATYEHRDDATVVSAARWDAAAGSWTFLGDVVGSIPPVSAREPSAAFDASGAPVVSRREHIDDRRDVVVARWSDDDSAWSELGGPVVVTFPSEPESYAVLEARLVLDPFGTLTLISAIDEGDEGPTALHTYDATAGTWLWQPLGFSVGAGFARVPALAFHGDGRPVVAHAQNVSGADNPVFVGTRAVGATTWTVLGPGSLTTPGWSARPTVDVVVAHDGTITVAWIEGAGSTNPNTLRLARFDAIANAWIDVPAPVAAGQTVVRALDPVRLAVDAERRVVIAWSADFVTPADEENRRWTHVHRLAPDGSGWEQLGPPLHVPSVAPNASRPALALDAAGAPSVAFQATPGVELPVVVRRWNGP